MPLDDAKPDESLHDTLSAAYDENIGKSADVSPAAQPVPSAKTPGVDTPVAPADAKAPAAAPAAPVPAGPVDGAAPAAGTPLAAPSGFPDVAAWEAMPDPVRKWVKNRESQFEAGIRRYADAAKFAQTIAAELKPYQWMLDAKGVPPAQLVKEAMQLHTVMSTGHASEKAQLFANMARHYGVDLAQIADGQVPQAPQQNPEIAELRQVVHSLASRLRGQDEQQARQEAGVAWSTVDGFAKNPAMKHFELVRLDMADLIDAGKATDLQDAYDKALWMRADTRALLLADQAAQRTTTARAAAGESTAMGGAAIAGAAPSDNESLRSTIERAWSSAA